MVTHEWLLAHRFSYDGFMYTHNKLTLQKTSFGWYVVIHHSLPIFYDELECRVVELLLEALR